MKAGQKPRSRPLALVGFAFAVTAMSASCGSGDEEIVTTPPAPLSDAGADTSSFGGTGGAGSGGTGSGTGGVSGTGTLGSGGSGGSSGTGSSGASGSGSGTCNPDFCPNNGVGTPCCVVEGVGPCGFDNGMGCRGGPLNDF